MSSDEWGKGPAIETGEVETANPERTSLPSDSGSTGPATPYEDVGPADVPTDPSDPEEGSG